MPSQIEPNNIGESDAWRQRNQEHKQQQKKEEQESRQETESLQTQIEIELAREAIKKARAKLNEKKEKTTIKKIKTNEPRTLPEDETIINVIKHYWKEGKRSQLCMSLSGFLYKNNYTIEHAEQIIRRICIETKDNEQEQRITALHHTYSKNKEDILAYSGLYEIIPKEELQDIIPKDKILRIDNYIDNVERFWKRNPFFYDKTNMFWMWNPKQYCYERIDDTDLMILIDQQLGLLGQTVTSGIKGNYIEAFKRVGRIRIPKEVPKTWVQFKREIVKLEEQTIIEATPEYFTTNPIPHELGTIEDTPVMDKLFVEWVGKEQKETLYQILAYCVLCDYPIHTLFALIGSGRNGKSRFLELISRFVGKNNCCSTELDTLLSRTFESAKLYKKLVCIMGETNFGTISKTSLLKKLTGQDMIGFEFKQKTPFDDYNYAKIIISSNSLPTSDDTSEGFYRRWMIINFPNNFNEGKDILATIPEQEYKNLARKSIKILWNLLNEGQFKNQGSIEERKQNYIKASNPLSLFIQEYCDIGEDNFIKYGELYTNYVQYLNKHKMRRVKHPEFKSTLEQEGFNVDKTSKYVDGSWENTRYIIGLKLKSNIVRDFWDSWDRVSTLFPIQEKLTENTVLKVTNVPKVESLDDFEPSFLQLELILLDRVPQEIKVDTLISYGFTPNQIQKWKDEGLIIELPEGTVRLT